MLDRYTKKLVGSDEERAVSPVIGVILMVAITVILAAVIAAFVLDIGPGDPDPNAVVDYSVSETDEDGFDFDIELTSTDNADGVVLVIDNDIKSFDTDSENEHVLTTSGEEQFYDDVGDNDEDEDATIHAVQIEDPTELGSDASIDDDEIEANAIVENIDLEEEA